MNHWAPKLTGLALLGFVLSSPVAAGHMSGKGYKHHGNHAMHMKGGHSHCHKMKAKKRYMGYGTPSYGRPYGPMTYGPHYGKGKGYQGHGYRAYGPMHHQHSKDKSSYSASKGYPAQDYNEQTSAAPASTGPKNIVETAVAAGQFSTLIKAAQAAGLVGTLNGEGPFTVFAPTDAAFAKLPEGTVEGLLKDTDALTKVLTYHVTGGNVLAADLLENGSVATLNGAALDLGQLDVVKADVVTANGVIHIIDEVLLPPQS